MLASLRERGHGIHNVAMIAANPHVGHKAGHLDLRVRWIEAGGESRGLSLEPCVVDLHRLPYRRALGSGRTQVARILARYLGCREDAVAFQSGPAGRPRLADPEADLDFNLSHSGERLLLAVAAGRRRVGIDVERFDPRRDYLALARHQFRDGELALVESESEPARAAAFLRLWTAKEALVKALGAGLAAMSEIRLAIDRDGALVPRALPRDGGDPGAWRVMTIERDGGYHSALACGPRAASRTSRRSRRAPRGVRNDSG